MRERFGLGILWRLAALTAITLGVLAWSKPLQAQVNNASPWFGSQPPRIQQLSDVAPVNRVNYNADCNPGMGVTGSGATVEGCATYTPYGVFNSGYLQLYNTGQYGLLRETVWPIPNSTTVLRPYQGTPTVGSLYAISNYPAKIESHKASDGQVQYNLLPYEPIYFRDRKGELLNIDYSSITFSGNGDWMLAIADESVVRVNLRTFEATLFDEPYYHGDRAQAQTAITNDGRYAAISSALFSRFRLYDLQACNGLDCPFRDLLADLPPQTGNDLGDFELRFLSDYTLDFYRREQFEARVVWTRYTLTAAGQRTTHFEYLALGDSFASGEGAYDYKADTDTSTNKCHVSRLAYPYLIRSALSLNTAESVACSGAVIKDITDSSPDYSGQVEDGLSRQSRNPSSITASFSPGYLAQSELVSAYMPDAITVSISGNDIGFGRKLLRCIEPDTCYASYEDRLELVREINSKFDRLVETYAQLKASSVPSAHIYALGYPQLLKNNGDCGLNVRLAAEEVVFSNLLIDYLNNVIERAAQKAGVVYIDLSQAFLGHRLCEVSSSNIAVHGVTAGTDTFNFGLFKGPVANESFHPNAQGQQLLKESILRATSNLTAPMPQAIPALAPPDESQASTLLQAPRANRPIYLINYDNDLANNVITREIWWNITVKSSEAFFRPDTTVRAVLHSDPQALGEFMVGPQGDVQARVKLPATTPVGFHTLHLYGENQAGEAIDVYQIVYISDAAQEGTPTGLANSLGQQPPNISRPSRSEANGKPIHLVAVAKASGVLSTSWSAKPKHTWYLACFIAPIFGATLYAFLRRKKKYYLA